MNTGKPIPPSQNLIDILRFLEYLKKLTEDENVQIRIRLSGSLAESYDFIISWWVGETYHSSLTTLCFNDLDSIKTSTLDVIQMIFTERYNSMSKYELQTGSITCLGCGEAVIGDPTKHYKSERHLAYIRRIEKADNAERDL